MIMYFVLAIAPKLIEGNQINSALISDNNFSHIVYTVNMVCLYATLLCTRSIVPNSQVRPSVKNKLAVIHNNGIWLSKSSD